MTSSSVIKRRVTNGDLIRHGACPIRAFKVYIIGLDLSLINKFNLVVDITEKNFRDCAEDHASRIMGDRCDYILKVQGEHTTIILNKERLDNSYKVSLCKVMDYDSEEYIKELDNEIVKICLKSNSDSIEVNKILFKEDVDDRIRLMTSPDSTFRSMIDYSGFGVI